MYKYTDTSITDNPKLDKIAKDLLQPVGLNIRFHIWMGLLTLGLMACLYAYWIQLNEGLIVTGLRDHVSWGMYLANFVFFVAASLIGMLISGILGLLGQEWIKPIARIAEIIAVAFAAVAGMVIVSDMGRPDRLPYVFMYGRIQSPILWDVTVVTTYMVISLLLWFIPMIPDMAIAKSRMDHCPKWLSFVYNILSLKWTHHPEQYKILFKATRILFILVVPTAFAIHTVTSWLFAVNPRAGWDSTIFGPYFLTGAFVAGSAGLIMAMYFFRNNYRLKAYITTEHFNKMGKLLFLTGLIYLYFNINEYIVPGYKLKTADAIHLKELLTGHFAPLFWSVQIGGLIIPLILLLFKRFRQPGILTIIAVFVFIASWFKRYLIVVPTMEHPYLPKQFLPQEWMLYQPTLIETAITIAPFILVLMIITVLSKLFPVVPIWEMAELGEQHEAHETHPIDESSLSDETDIKSHSDE
ncbi:NrfD/PsrC family molybdoenzyme membrane anchor subunit [Geofilum rubicundum]|nr:NrfD/PsrC family molybdoenzyme membrane anchor subunit [Geofilum rubicundum]